MDVSLEEEMSYAENTSVPVDRSQGEIRRILEKYKASGFAFGEQGPLSVVMFEMAGRRIKFIIPMPEKPRQSARLVDFSRFDQKCRTKWRCLVLVIKAKLEAVESGITTLEEEFLAHIVLPNGRTAGEMMIPQIEKSYQENKMPPLLGYSP